MFLEEFFTNKEVNTLKSLNFALKILSKIFYWDIYTWLVHPLHLQNDLHLIYAYNYLELFLKKTHIPLKQQNDSYSKKTENLQ